MCCRMVPDNLRAQVLSGMLLFANATFVGIPSRAESPKRQSDCIMSPMVPDKLFPRPESEFLLQPYGKGNCNEVQSDTVILRPRAAIGNIRIDKLLAVQ